MGRFPLFGAKESRPSSAAATLSPWDVVYSVAMAIASAASYWTMTYALAPVVGRGDELLGGMWAAVATVFVFRTSRNDSLSAGWARLITAAKAAMTNKRARRIILQISCDTLLGAFGWFSVGGPEPSCRITQRARQLAAMRCD